MNRYVRKRSGKIGMAPGTVVFTGTRRVEKSRITLIRYGETEFFESEFDSFADLVPELDRPGTKWLNIDGIHDADLIQAIGDRYGNHPLVLEDIASPGQRAKVEEYGDHTYILARMISYDTEKREIDAEQVSLIVKSDMVISFQERPGDVFGPVRDRLHVSSGRIRSRGPDYLAYALLDVIVDHYFVTLEAFGEEIGFLEEEVIVNPEPEIQKRIRALRGNLILVRRAAWPMRELLGVMARTESPIVNEETRMFVRDAHDHAVQALDIVESLRDVVGGITDLYMSSLSNRMNDIMKVLTIIGTIFIPLSFIAGLYGMNFDNMPELHLKYGYGIALGLMLSVAGGLLLFFRRKGWL